MKVLGIESSCDETAAAVVENGQLLLSNVVNSQIDIHAVYGGVVPEVAARSHLEVVVPVIQKALDDASCTWNDIDAIAVTYAPGLVGSLLIGTLAARTLALLKNKPLYPIHHVEGHVYANFLSSKPSFPLLSLIVSGGHSQLVLFKGHGDYILLGQTQDDAVGEAFDKVAKIIGLPYPGGPSIAQLAPHGDPTRFAFPKARMKNPYDFSFSGLKTAVLRQAQALCGQDYSFPSTKLPEALSEAQKADLAASFQRVACETIVDKAVLACVEFGPKSVVLAGGVAASQELRRQLVERIPVPIEFPDFKLCTDNGAMIATLGCFKAMREQPQADPLTLDIAPNLSM